MDRNHHAHRAAERGWPATFMGFTPDQRGYFMEPGLPWQPRTDSPAYVATPDRRGQHVIWHYLRFACDYMAPRFPGGTVVNIAPVWHRDELEVGRVYAHVYQDAATKAKRAQVGRLAFIGGNYLELTLDNAATGLLWPLRADETEATWDVYEVTHYVAYPGEDETAAGV
ncbi:hypothetical protein [Hymenobacter negativus]|uniref:Uncharacterized protein n=1 Tax=Hymenobacter negativus TaxID=2795026 RepID=A0ABS3QIB0_9BACT|nr:hypothetical protein [Hymenobacter negativus]MBO2010866.1 hypothetical protein [Hymenobacter negativus]